MSKKKAIILGASAFLVVAAAVAIPVGIVYGTKSSSSSETKVPTYDVSTDKDQLQTWKPGAQTAPTELPKDKGFDPALYDATKGAIVDTNVVAYGMSNATKPGTEGLYVTCEYPALADANTKIRVKYAVSLVKGTAAKMDPATNDNAKLALNYTYSTEPAAYDFSAQQLAAGKTFFGYKTATGPVFESTAATPAALTVDDIKALAKDATFTATYSAQLDTDFFEDNKVTSGSFKVTYTVVPLELTPPTEISVQKELKFGEAFALEAAPTPPTGYALTSQTPTTAIDTQPDGATATPAKGEAVVVANVSNYELGTVFTVTYSFGPANANYTGTYNYVFTYTIGLNAVTAPSSTVYAATVGTYGSLLRANPTPPVDPNGSKGFAGTYLKAEIDTKSDIDDANSPAVGVAVDWAAAATQQINSGTVIKITYKYSAKPGYVGDDFELTQLYTVNRALVNDGGNDIDPLDTATYIRGTDVNLATPTSTEAWYSAFTIAAGQPKYYTGQLPNNATITSGNSTTFAAAGAELAPAGVKALAAGAKFTAVWEFTIKPNYLYGTGARTSFFWIKPYQVVPTSLAYTGSMSYSNVNVEYSTVGSDVTFTKPVALPETTAATNGDKFDFDASYNSNAGVKYRVTTPGAGGPSVGDIADLSAFNTYPVGTVVTATYQFKGKSDNANAAKPTVTKTFTVVRKRVAVDADLNITAVNTTGYVYGTEVSTVTARKPTNEAYYGAATIAYYGSDGTTATTTAAIKALPAGSTAAFTIKWTYNLDTSKYESTNTPTKNTYVVTEKFAVAKATASYTNGKSTYDTNATLTYGSDFSTIAAGINTNSQNLPESAKNVGYTFGGKSYAVTTPSTDGKTTSATVVSEADMSTYGAGTVITVTYTFVPDANHTGANQTATSTITIQ